MAERRTLSGLVAIGASYAIQRSAWNRISANFALTEFLRSSWAKRIRGVGASGHLHTSGHFRGDPFRDDPLGIYLRHGTRARRPLAPDVPPGRRLLYTTKPPRPRGREDRLARGDGGGDRLLPAAPARPQRPAWRPSRRDRPGPRTGPGGRAAQH